MSRLSSALNYQNTEAGRAVIHASVLREKARRRVLTAKMTKRPRFRAKNLLQAKLHQMLRVKRDKPTPFGCSSHELQDHFRKQFRPGWTFDNRGTAWDIDHVVPLVRFKIHEFLSAFHYTNLRPRSSGLNRVEGWLVYGATKYL